MSSPPVKYLRYFDFTTFATNNPSTPLPGASVDVELNRLLTTSNQTIDRLAEIQRDDGKLKDGAITTNSLLDGSVTEPKLATGAVSTRALADGSVTGPKIAPGSINGAALAPGSIGSTQILDGGVQTVDLADLSVTQAKLALLSVGAPQLIDASVTPAKLAPATISAFAPAVHPHPQSDVVNLVADLALKAPLASPALSGIPTAPTPATGTNTTQLATTAFVAASMSAAGAITEAPNDGALYGRQALGWQLGVKLAGDIMTGVLQLPALRLGGATAAFAALKSNGPELQARLADDSGFAAFASASHNPGTNILNSLGTAALRWLKLWAKDGDFSGDVNIAGALSAGSIAPATLSQIQSNPNKIINGDFRINQRYGAVGATPALSAYVSDRWYMMQSVGTKLTGTAVTGPSIIGANTSPLPASQFQMTVFAAVAAPAGSDYWGLSQAIEGLNCVDTLWGTVNARPITISFWAQSTVTGQYGGSVRNSAGNRCYPFAFTITAASTWQRFTVTIPGDTIGTWLTDTGIGMFVTFMLGVGGTMQGVANTWAATLLLQPTGCINMMATLNARFDISGVKVELGSNATPFVTDDVQVSLAKCQRYYWKDITAKYYPLVLDGSNAEMPGAWCFNPVQMRTTPAMLGVAVGAFYYNNGAGQVTATPVGGTGSTSGNNQSQVYRYTWATGQGPAQVQKPGQWLLQLAADAEL